MTRLDHIRATLVLGLPLIGGHLAQFAIGLTDTVMIGWYGVDELAAITLAGTYFFVLFLLGSGFAWAVMPMVAAFDAQEDETSLRRVTRMGLWLTILYCALALPFLWWSEPVLQSLGQKPQVASNAAVYLRIAGWGMFPALLVMVLKSYLAGLERTQIVLWITCIAAAVNAVANYGLIFGNFGLPEMGLQGAAVASIITQGVSLVGVVIYAVRVLPQHDLFARLWRPDWEMFRSVFRMGLPIGLTTLSEVSLFAASAVMMGWIGTVALASHGIALQLASATFFVHLGISNAATIRVGQAHGRGDQPFQMKAAVAASALSLGMALVTIFVFLVWPDFLIRSFLDSADPDLPEIVAVASVLLAVAALFQLVDGAQVIALGLLRGLQDTTRPMIYAAISYWGVGLPASYALGFWFGFGGVGVWLGLVVGLACAAVLLGTRFWNLARSGGVTEVPKS